MVEYLAGDLLYRIDSLVASSLLPVALWILLSGVDDLVVLGIFLYGWARALRAGRSEAPGVDTAEPLIAIFVPCWREDRVIADMLEHNISAIRYRRYAFFVGAYPNDEATIGAIQRAARRSAKVHLCLCPHDGPTSKADCLNWLYQRMLLVEEETGSRYAVVMTHDAEDLIHPEELVWISKHIGEHDMIQTPVLALPTPFLDFTHGLYCDDFAECHTKDMPARQVSGSFIPSSGVGTAYSRNALEKLAESQSNRVFEPACLAEDYENGLRLRQLGCSQVFLPIRSASGALVATREFFPRDFVSAVRQRSRWITGIALQTWERHGWGRDARQFYWLWRDRKGLIGNPVSALSNLLFAYGALTWTAARLTGTGWTLMAAAGLETMTRLLAVTLSMQVIHLAVRMACVARIYGIVFALGVPFRTVYGNFVNSVATVLAVWRYLQARWRREPLVWVKTEHAYPSRMALMVHKRPLEEILLGASYITGEQLALARSTKPRGVRLEEHLVHSGILSEEELYEALSLQMGVALGQVDPRDVPRKVARALPARLIREWNVLPVRIEGGSIYLASTNLVSEELQQALRRHTRLEIRVQLVTPSNFRRLAEGLL